MKWQKIQQGQGPLELLEESVHLLRLAPAAALFSYYLGTLPFVLGLLYFWADMSRGSFAETRLALAAAGMALLFAWMKLWQTVFAHRLLARLCGEPVPRLSWRRLLRAALVQTIIQPSGLVLLPLALVTLAPFGWVYAFYQSVTVLGAGDTSEVKPVLGRAWRQAMLWPAQNICALLALMLFGFFVFLNVLSGFLSVPFLIKMLLGLESVFTRSLGATLNTTFFAVVLCLTYLCLDPLARAFYVLRCFYGESLRTGQDLKTDLRAFASKKTALAALAVGLLFTALPGRAAASEPTPTRNAELETRNSITPPDLDHSINKVINRREFDWRLPRVQPTQEKEKGALVSFLEMVSQLARDFLRQLGDWIDRFFRWIFGSRFRPKSADGTGWITGLQWLVALLLVALVCVLAVMLLRVWRRRRQKDAVAAQPLPAQPDVADENVGADQLPEDGWIKLARELLERGELRLALRAFYLSSLAHLAGKSLINLAKFKSNRDYERELARRQHALPALTAMFSENVSVFDRAWYGWHEVTRDMLDQFAGNVERIKTQS